MSWIHYILIASICLSISYLAYLIIFRNQGNFKQLRYFLLSIIILSVLMPFNAYKIDIFPGNSNKTNSSQPIEKTIIENVIVNSAQTNESNQKSIEWVGIIKAVYYLVAFFLLLRILFQVFSLLYFYFRSEKVKKENCILVYNNRYKHSFSFFNWIIIPNEIAEKGEHHNIITHEKIHVSQYHSIDLILIELLSAVMWFNPLVWKMKNSIQLVHEFLADEGALDTGIDRLRYQALLLNQVAEERLICLSSSFNHSLIKKRMIMMTNRKINQDTKLKILTLFPIAAVLFIAVILINGFIPRTARAASASSAMLSFGPDLRPINNLSIKAVNDTTAGKVKKKNEKTVKIVHKTNADEACDSTKIEYIIQKELNWVGHDNSDSIVFIKIQKNGDTLIMNSNNNNNASVVKYFIDELHVNDHGDVHTDSTSAMVINFNGEHIVINKSADGNDTKKVIYIIDGKECTDPSELENMESEKVKTVKIIKGKDKITEYTTEDCDVITIITTKSKEK